MKYLHPSTQQRLDRFIAQPSQSTLLVGDEGIGFGDSVEYIAEGFGVPAFVIWPEKNGTIDREAGTITTEMIRSLYDKTKVRAAEKQLIVIDEADRMSSTAQNAFLKLLEEPSPSTYFILVTHQPTTLLPTIRSRVTTISLTPLTNEQSNVLLDELAVTDTTKRQQLLFIAEGMPALLTKLAQDEAFFVKRSQTVRDARTLIQGTTYEKLKIVNNYRDREASLSLLKDAGRLLRRNTTPDRSRAILKQLEKLLNVYEHIEANGNVRLWLTMAVV